MKKLVTAVIVLGCILMGVNFAAAADGVSAEAKLTGWVDAYVSQGASNPHTSVSLGYGPQDEPGLAIAYSTIGTAMNVPFGSNGASWDMGPGLGLYTTGAGSGNSAYAKSTLTDTFQIGLPQGYNPANYQGAVLRMHLSSAGDDAMGASTYGGKSEFRMSALYGGSASSLGGFGIDTSGLHFTGGAVGPFAGLNNANLFLDPLNSQAKSSIEAQYSSAYGYNYIYEIGTTVSFLLPGLTLNTPQEIQIAMAGYSEGPYAYVSLLNTLKFDEVPFALYSQDGNGGLTITELDNVGGTWGSVGGMSMQQYTAPTTVTPEPISSALFLLGAGALAGARKMRRKQS